MDTKRRIKKLEEDLGQGVDEKLLEEALRKVNKRFESGSQSTREKAEPEKLPNRILH